MDISARLRSKMNDIGLSESELGRRANVPQPTINRILSGESASPRKPTVERLALALGVTPDWLLFGGNVSTESAGRVHRPDEATIADSSILQLDRIYSVPLISLNLAKDWVSGGYKMKDFKIEAYLPCPVAVGKRAFAFRMPNDSMLGSRPDKPIFEGWAVFIDPDVLPETGQVGLASIDGHEPILGVLTRHGGRLYIKPANPQFEKEEVSQDTTEWSLGRAVFTGYSM